MNSRVDTRRTNDRAIDRAIDSGAIDNEVWAATVRLALIVSTVAAFAVMALGAAGDVTEPAVVLVVILIGFAASWAQCERLARPADGHRVTVVALRRRVG